MLETCDPLTAIVHDPHAVRVSTPACADADGRFFTALAEVPIAIDAVARSSGGSGGCRWDFTVGRADLDRLRQVLATLGAGFEIDPAVVKISLLGWGLLSHPETTGRMLAVLAGSRVRPYSVATSETRIVVIVAAADGTRAVRALRATFRIPAPPSRLRVPFERLRVRCRRSVDAPAGTLGQARRGFSLVRRAKQSI